MYCASIPADNNYCVPPFQSPCMHSLAHPSQCIARAFEPPNGGNAFLHSNEATTVARARYQTDRHKHTGLARCALRCARSRRGAIGPAAVLFATGIVREAKGEGREQPYAAPICPTSKLPSSPHPPPLSHPASPATIPTITCPRWTGFRHVDNQARVHCVPCIYVLISLSFLCVCVCRAARDLCRVNRVYIVVPRRRRLEPLYRWPTKIHIEPNHPPPLRHDCLKCHHLRTMLVHTAARPFHTIVWTPGHNGGNANHSNVNALDAY